MPTPNPTYNFTFVLGEKLPYVHEAVYAILRAASVGNLRPANYPDFPDKLSSTNGYILSFSAYY